MAYNPDDKPTVEQLDIALKTIHTDWKRLAIHLPGIETHHTEEIEASPMHHGTANQKFALYKKWLDLQPNAKWSNIADALKIIDKESLALSLLRQQPTTVASLGMGVDDQTSTISLEEEETVENTLLELHDSFASLMHKVRKQFNDNVTQKPSELQEIIGFANCAS